MMGSMEEGIKLYQLGRCQEALQKLLLVDVGSDPGSNLELSYYLGLCYTKLGRYEDALVYLEQVVTSGDNPMRVYQCRMTLAYIYILTRRAKMAEFELHRLTEKGFESAQLYATLGYAAWSQKQYDRAVECYEQALKLDKTNSTAMNGLGYVLVDAELDVPRGLKFCKKAVELKPHNAAYLDSLGWACFKNGELTEARTLLRQAVKAAPDQSEIRDHLRIVTGE